MSSPRPAPPELHACQECGDVFPLSRRRSFEHRRRGTKPICRSCRLPSQALSPQQRAELRRYWLENFSREELEEIAVGLWPDLLPRRLSVAA